MEFISRLIEQVGGSAAGALSSMIEAIRTAFEGDPETRRRVAFSVAMIALSAKMAKADGIVTESEVSAFQDIFAFPADEANNVARLYNLAKQDVAGFDSYAARLAGLCSSGDFNCPVLEDILDGLFHIAKADGVVHEKELAFLDSVATIFHIDEEHFARIKARHVFAGERDPYFLLGLTRDADLATVKKRYRALVAENHPDRMIARGVPEEFLAIANDRAAAINAAYEEIVRDRKAA